MARIKTSNLLLVYQNSSVFFLFPLSTLEFYHFSNHWLLDKHELALTKHDLDVNGVTDDDLKIMRIFTAESMYRKALLLLNCYCFDKCWVVIKFYLTFFSLYYGFGFAWVYSGTNIRDKVKNSTTNHCHRHHIH